MRKKVEFSSHTGNLALMRRFVRKFLEGYPFSEKERTLMVLGVDEACTNIIRHAYQLHDIDQLAIVRPVTKGVFSPATGPELYPAIRSACAAWRPGVVRSTPRRTSPA